MGFTLIELLVGISLSAMVVAAALITFIHQQRTYHTIKEMVSVQQNLRPALELLVRDLRTAGYGLNMPDEDISQWFPWVSGATSRVVVTEGGAASTPDELLILGAFGAPESRVQFGTNPGDTRIYLPAGENSQFNTIDKRVILVGRQETARIVGFSGDQIIVSTDPVSTGAGLRYGYPSGAPIERVKAVSYRTGTNTNEAPELLYLTRDEHIAVLPPLADRVLAVHIENFKLAMVGSNTVTVTLTGRTRHEDEYNTQPGANDGYRRESVSTRVLLRNPIP